MATRGKGNSLSAHKLGSNIDDNRKFEVILVAPKAALGQDQETALCRTDPENYARPELLKSI